MSKIPTHATPLPVNAFVKLFPNATPLVSTQADLQLLATTMLDPNARGPITGSTLPAGITYLGQFIDHDLTLDLLSNINSTQVPADQLVNERTSFFDLDNVYGLTNQFLNANGLFDIAVTASGEDDLPRNPNTGAALISDGRDDENRIISGLQLLFFKFHNRVFAELQLANPKFTIPQLITLTKQTVVLHYQYIVVNDFLKTLCGNTFFARLFDANGKPLIHPAIITAGPSISLEFSGAAYRFGHSMVRDAYYINKDFDVFPIFSPTLPSPLVTIPDLRGNSELPPNQTIDWSVFFPMPKAKGFQVTENLDAFVTKALFTLPTTVVTDSPAILPLRNLMRGMVYGLQSGQDLASAIGIPVNEILSASAGNLVFQTLNQPIVNEGDIIHLTNTFGEQTPLFYYCLKDNHVNGNGNHLGALPSAIIGQTFLSLLLQSPTSYLNNNFSPTVGKYGCIRPNIYTMTEFITYALNIPYSVKDEIPSPDYNCFDPFENRQGLVSSIGHSLQPSLGIPGVIAPDAVVLAYPGRVIHKYDPTLTLPPNTTQTEINTVAANAVAAKLDPTLAVVKFLNNRTILGIAQGIILPLAPPAPPAVIVPPASNVVPPTPPVPVLTPDQRRGNAIFLSQDIATFMLQPEAISLVTTVADEITKALTPGGIPPIIVV
jgi:hypothetical protein